MPTDEPHAKSLSCSEDVWRAIVMLGHIHGHDNTDEVLRRHLDADIDALAEQFEDRQHEFEQETLDDY